MKRLIRTALFFTLISFSIAEVDYSGYVKLLDKYVDTNGFVDYKNMKKGELLSNVVKVFEGVEFQKLNKEERLAFLINSYNLAAIKNVITYYPIGSPTDVKDFFKEKVITLNGKKYSLDEIEYELLFKIDDVMIHFGIVCVAESCPKLLNVPYTGENVYKLLQNNLTHFLANEKKNRIDHDSKTIYLSQIFRWFKKQFEAEYGSLISLIKKYAPENWVHKNNLAEYEINYLNYDWALNEQ